MRVLVIQQDEDKPLGRFEEPLRAAGLELDVRLAGRDPLELEDHAAVIGLPGFANPVDETEAVISARAVFDEALRTGRPSLGLCLGAQLLGQAAGATAGKCTSEYGYAPVELTEAAGRDRLLGGLPGTWEVFHAHDYAVSLPPGATPLARTDNALQAFHVAPVAWGFQFHPEPSVEIVDAWVATHGDFLRRNGVDPARVAADARRLDGLTHELTTRIAERFAAVVREHAGRAEAAQGQKRKRSAAPR
jgi:GMP synthase (glutamine-hydrolysing)